APRPRHRPRMDGGSRCRRRRSSWWLRVDVAGGDDAPDRPEHPEAIEERVEQAAGDAIGAVEGRAMMSRMLLRWKDQAQALEVTHEPRGARGVRVAMGLVRENDESGEGDDEDGEGRRGAARGEWDEE